MAQATNALDTLGELLPRDPGRDAIHIATFAVTSDERLFPGQHIGFTGYGNKVSASAKKMSGIVDPYLPSAVFPGQMFWLLLYPRSITSLRHAWTHPDVPSEEIVQPPNKAESEKWLRDFLSDDDKPTFEDAMRSIMDNDGGLVHSEGRDAHGEIPDEFWHHAEIVLGRKFPRDDRADYFSCSC